MIDYAIGWLLGSICGAALYGIIDEWRKKRRHALLYSSARAIRYAQHWTVPATTISGSCEPTPPGQETNNNQCPDMSELTKQ